MMVRHRLWYKAHVKALGVSIRRNLGPHQLPLIYELVARTAFQYLDRHHLLPSNDITRHLFPIKIIFSADIIIKDLFALILPVFLE